VDDVGKIFCNCRAYNKKDSLFCRLAGELEEAVGPHLRSLKMGRREEKKVKL